MLNLLDSWLKVKIGEGAFYAVFGFVFVVAGITLLILIFTLFGAIMKRINEKREASAARAVEAKLSAPQEESGDEPSPEVIAAITAAIAAYYEGEKVACDFVVRRIKKIESARDHHA